MRFQVQIVLYARYGPEYCQNTSSRHLDEASKEKLCKPATQQNPGAGGGGANRQLPHYDSNTKRSQLTSCSEQPLVECRAFLLTDRSR